VLEGKYESENNPQVPAPIHKLGSIVKKQGTLRKFGINFALLTLKKQFWSILWLEYFSAI